MKSKFLVRGLFPFLVAACTALSVRGMPTDPAVGVVVKVWAQGVVTGVGGYVDVSGTFLPSSPTATDGSADASDASDFTGVPLMAILGTNGYVRVEPAKTYTINVSSTSMNSGNLSIVAPPGYRVVLDNMLRTNESFSGSATMVFQVLPLGARHPGLAGMASSISSMDIDWRVSLGSVLNGGSAGDLALIDTGMRSDWSVIASPSSLYYESVSQEVSVYRPNGYPQQIVADQVAIDVVALPAGAPTYFEIRCYNPSQMQGTGFPYTFSGQPYTTYRVQKGSTATSLTITKEVINVTDPNSTTLPVARREIMTLARTGTWPTVSWTKTDWTLENQTPLNEVDVTSSGTTSARTETIAVKTPGASTATINLTRNYSTPTDSNGNTVIGEVLSGETVGSTTPASSSFNYYTSAAQWGSFGFLKSATLPGGNWVAFDYYSGDPTVGQPSGRIRYAYKPYLNAPGSISQSPTSGEVTYYEYANDIFGSPTLPALIQTTINGTVVAKSTISYSTSGSNFIATRVDSTDSGHSLTTITASDPDNDWNTFMRGQVVSIQKPDGVVQSYTYELGVWDGTTFTPNTGSSASRISTIVGLTNNSYVDGKSTKDVTIRDNRALVVRTESYAWKNSAWVLMTWTNFTYDFAGRLTQRVASNGATYTATYDGGLKTSETNEAGVTTTYTYDAGDRIATSTRVGVGTIPSVTTAYTYDATGNTLETDVGSGQSEMITTKTQYDDAGRVTMDIPPGNYGVVTHSYDVANRVTTVTNADGGTVITTSNLDGSLASTTGTATVAAYHTYGVETDGRQWHQVNTGSANSPRWQKSWVDWAGRTLETDTPGFTGQPTVIATNVYENGTGHLIETTKTGYAATLFQYNTLGQVSRSGLDYDGNGTLDLASSDRITETESYFENYNGAWWMRTDNRTYPTVGQSTMIVTSTSRTRLTGFPSNRQSETQSVDAEGNVTDQTVDVNRSAATSVATTTRTGLASPMVENTLDGVSINVTSFDGLLTSKQYDSLLRSQSVTDSRGNTVTTGYISGTSLAQTVTDAAGDQSVTSYDTVGRTSWTRDPMGYYTRVAYNQRGQAIEQWGDGTMPVSYAYDATYGDKISMSTYRAGSGWAGTTWPTSPGTADTTSWTYDPPTGLLTTKTDATGKSVTQTYNVRGQTATRTLARGVSTTYGYDGSTGELITQTYSDSTPSVTFTYGRTGQVDSVNDYTGYRDLVYDPMRPWRMTAEAESSFYGGRVLTRMYDNTTMLGRVNGVQLGSAPGSNADLEQTFGFTTVGRFASITSNRTGDTATAHTFNYGYLANSALLQSVALANTGFTITRSYEAHRDLITNINSQWSTTSETQFSYTYDVRGNRASAVQSGAAFADYGDSTFHLYNYDGRGEVTADVGYLGSSVTDQSKPLPGRHYGFGYDNAGNRLWSDRTGVDANNDGLPDMRDNYTTNALNQYVSRENNTVPLSGTAAPDTTPAGGAGGVSVAIKGRTVAAGRQGRYWNDEITVPNTLNPWRGPVTIFSAMRGTSGSPDLYRMDSRMVEIAAVLQNYTYDDDGNLTSDGLVDYTWDAENRLIRIETDSMALSYGFPHRLIEFKYDYMGRRVQKRVVDVDQNVELYCRRYLYDGWNLIAEYLAPGGTTLGSLVRSYTWGLDIALSMTNAGGVGALLQIADHPTGKTYVPTYDGNGNIVSLLNADSGALAAVYEYSPFGEPLRAQTYDATIADNPWRFSTKWTDLETGLIYYGHRYYDPHNGRFINRDPIEEQGGINLYGFCLNNAVNHWDVLGNVPSEDDHTTFVKWDPRAYVPGMNNIWWGNPEEAAGSKFLREITEGPDPEDYHDTAAALDAWMNYEGKGGSSGSSGTNDSSGQTAQNSTSSDGSSPTTVSFTNSDGVTLTGAGDSGLSNATISIGDLGSSTGSVTQVTGSSSASGPTNASSSGGYSDLTFNFNLDSGAGGATGATTSSNPLTFTSQVGDLNLTLPTATSSTAAAASSAPNSVDLGGSSAKTPTNGAGWGTVMVVYDGAEKADPNNPQHATGAQLGRLANNTVTDSKYAINAQSAVAGSAIALDNGISTHSVNYVVVLDHGDTNWYGGMRQQLGDNLLTKNDMTFLSVFVKPGGAVVLYGCSAGDSSSYLQSMANAAGTRVYAFPFDVALKSGAPLPSPAPDWPYKDPVVKKGP